MRRVLKWVGIGFGVILILGIIGSIVGGGSRSNTSQVAQAPTIAATATSSPTTKPTTVPPTATKVPQWVEIARWSGNSIKNTENFTVPSYWRIRWSTQPGQFGAMNFQIYVYKGTSLAGIAANVIGAGEDVSYQREAGTYYLTINSAQPYTVIIEGQQ